MTPTDREHGHADGIYRNDGTAHLPRQPQRKRRCEANTVWIASLECDILRTQVSPSREGEAENGSLQVGCLLRSGILQTSKPAVPRSIPDQSERLLRAFLHAVLSILTQRCSNQAPLNTTRCLRFWPDGS